MSSRISVVTINYNECDKLKNTLESTFAQTVARGRYEAIVVDGGSDDCSLKVIEDMDCLLDHWVSEPDDGIYDAMNKGVAAATGDYVIFMNAGDCFFSSGVLQQVAQRLDDGMPSVFFGKVYARGSSQPYQYNQHLWQGMICSHQATFARRELLQRFPFSTAFKIASDYHFFVQCDRNGHSPQFTDIDVATIDTGGRSFSGFAERTEERMRICAEAYPHPHVYQHFTELFRRNNVPLPTWARTQQDWLNRTG